VPGASGEFTYPEVGATREVPMEVSRRYHRLSRRHRVGAPESFRAAAELVMGFGLQRGAGFEVDASTAVAQQGTEVLMHARFGPVRVAAPARVVYVLDEDDLRGFAYGTLAGHPECGEEAFLVERDPEGTWLEIRAFSRPGRWFTSLAGPLGRLLQRRATDRYVAAIRQALGGP
jgi:uncharacterized protein (UPF0548 family)